MLKYELNDTVVLNGFRVCDWSIEDCVPRVSYRVLSLGEAPQKSFGLYALRLILFKATLPRFGEDGGRRVNKKLTSFTRPFLTGRRTWAGHETSVYLGRPSGGGIANWKNGLLTSNVFPWVHFIHVAMEHRFSFRFCAKGFGHTCTRKVGTCYVARED